MHNAADESPRRSPLRIVLLCVFLVIFAISCINPDHPRDFILEHTFTAAGLMALFFIDRQAPLSNWSYGLLFIFFSLHVVGAHYTYSHVPYDQWSRAVTGTSISEMMHWERNHYDRLVHLAAGLLCMRPIRELAERWTRVSFHAACFIAIATLALFSMTYELIEWVFAMTMSEENAEIYNGQQGDVFDAQKDMALALLGSIASYVAQAVMLRSSRTL
ncbi:MAG: DUF2238 domain-containing protein [Phycisphaerales bacterium]